MPNSSRFVARSHLTFGVMGGKSGKIRQRCGKVGGKNGKGGRGRDLVQGATRDTAGGCGWRVCHGMRLFKVLAALGDATMIELEYHKTSGVARMWRSGSRVLGVLTPNPSPCAERGARSSWASGGSVKNPGEFKWMSRFDWSGAE